MAIRLHYFCGSEAEGRNFGDALSPLLVSRLSGRNVILAHFSWAELSAVGSILYYDCLWGCRTLKVAIRELLAPRVCIWGSGFHMQPCLSECGACLRKTDICAVRGALTLDVLRKGGYDTGHAVLGDPGILYAMLLDSLPPKKYALGIVPHYADGELGRGLDGHYIDVLASDPLATLKEIASCEKIVTSSLHALIVAHSLGIPVRLLKAKAIDDFKFRDYFSAYSMDVPDSRDYHVITADKVAAMKSRLLTAFPYK